jgi:hypothetical protein
LAEKSYRPRRERMTLWSSESKNIQPKTLHPGKLSFRNEYETKTF